MSLSVESAASCGNGWVLRSDGRGGRGGSGLSTLFDFSSMDRSTGVVELIAESEKDSVGSSKDTV